MKGVIGVNTPFLARPPIDPIMGLKAMRGENNYIVFFQKPGVADAMLAKDVGKTFRFFMRKSVRDGGGVRAAAAGDQELRARARASQGDEVQLARRSCC